MNLNYHYLPIKILTDPQLLLNKGCLQGRIQDFLKGGGLCPEIGQLGVVGMGESSEPLQPGVLG